MRVQFKKLPLRIVNWLGNELTLWLRYKIVAASDTHRLTNYQRVADTLGKIQSASGDIDWKLCEGQKERELATI